MVGHSANPSNPKPFVKWVGGKRQLTPELLKLMPKTYNKYFEPFLGGGALYFAAKPKMAFLNDINLVLIAAYKNIQSNPKKLIAALAEMETRYFELNLESRRAFYNNVREKFNDLRIGTYEKTASLIFLNRTCFNGLYRENSKGEFNVPFGDYKNPKICDETTLLVDADLLSTANLSSCSFEEAVKTAKKDDFVYFDPPYFPVSETAKFTKYNQQDFLIAEQQKLHAVFSKLAKKGCNVMLSNSYTPFIRELYKDFRQVTVHANRAVNSNAKGRGKIKELVILSY